MKKKKQKMLVCPVCGAQARMVTAGDGFGEKAIDPERKMFVCSRYWKGCNTYVYAQKGTDRPLGQMADPALRNLRIQAHRSIDKVVDAGIMSKADVYDYLADALGYKTGHFHLAQCSYFGCMETIRILGQVMENRKQILA